MALIIGADEMDSLPSGRMLIHILLHWRLQRNS